jgi:predicted AAA+ superfamily ATPase
MDKIRVLEEQIAKLPRGCISNKKINGRVRHYLQWTEEGKTKSKYIPDDLYDAIKKEVEQRKKLDEELRTLKKSMELSPIPENKQEKYEMSVIYGNALRRLTDNVKGMKKRDCFDGITTYLYGKVTPRVCSIYGLRRTGKTTMLHQAIAEMTEENFAKTVYIKAKKNQSMSMLDRDLKKLYENGYRYIFIDEITFLEDFVDTASFLSDIYAAMGMKIVLSGTDSLGFWFTENEELYDRAYTIHTTWIPYSEHARLLGTTDIDEYIKYGGTLRAGDNDFDDSKLRSEDVSFLDDESTRKYIDTAICKNIQHSLKCYENGTHFRHLQELYDANELTGAINRIIESMNHRFVLKVLNDTFESNDLKLAKKNLLRERNPNLRTDILDRVDTKKITERIMELLEIKNKEARVVPVTEPHVREIEEYLFALELIKDSPIRYDFESIKSKNDNKLFLQPGMRYCQAEVLVHSLKKDAIFSQLNEAEKEYVCNRILNEVKGRMLEEIVLYETLRQIDESQEVFKLQFDKGEFDMVIYDKEKHICLIFEIKYSTEIVPEQAKHLTDEEKCRRTEETFGEIVGKYVLYRGESQMADDGIEYWNVSEYLECLSESEIIEEDSISSELKNDYPTMSM